MFDMGNLEGNPERDSSLGELFKHLTSDVTLLVRQELDLFRVEMTEKGKGLGAGAGILSAAAVAGLFALGTLTAAVILLLALVMPAWGGALIVTAAYGIAAAILASSGKRKIEDAAPPVPRQTIETVKEDIEWAKTQARSAKK